MFAINNLKLYYFYLCASSHFFFFFFFFYELLIGPQPPFLKWIVIFL